MITILAAIALIILTWRFFKAVDWFFLITALIILTTIFINGHPIEGYKEPELVGEVDLVSLNNSVIAEGNANLFYVSVSSTNTYSYRYAVNDNYSLDGIAYRLSTVNGKVTEIESDNCEKPVLKIYKRAAKRGWFTFAVDCDKIEYVFYVPTGTIAKDIVLN